MCRYNLRLTGRAGKFQATQVFSGDFGCWAVVVDDNGDDDGGDKERQARQAKTTSS